MYTNIYLSKTCFWVTVIYRNQSMFDGLFFTYWIMYRYYWQLKFRFLTKSQLVKKESTHFSNIIFKIFCGTGSCLIDHKIHFIKFLWKTTTFVFEKLNNSCLKQLVIICKNIWDVMGVVLIKAEEYFFTFEQILRLTH